MKEQTKRQKKRAWKTGPPPLYPWAKWFGMTAPFSLRRGEDCLCKTSSMAVMLRQKAPKFGWRVSISIRGDTLRVEVKR